LGGLELRRVGNWNIFSEALRVSWLAVLTLGENTGSSVGERSER